MQCEQALRMTLGKYENLCNAPRAETTKLFGVLAEAARLVREILRTVAQCHSRNVIVRDVKPDNFLFLNSNEHSGLRAIDFGLAEYCEPGQYLTDKVTAVCVETFF